jgi:serine/threonine-protein kinase HipA
MSGRKADVHFQSRLAGRLSEAGKGYVFQYDLTYLADGKAICLTMPLRAEPYESEALPAFFEGLLPEGWYLEIASRVLKIDPADKFGLLRATCRDCIGAVSIRAED